MNYRVARARDVVLVSFCFASVCFASACSSDSSAPTPGAKLVASGGSSGSAASGGATSMAGSGNGEPGGSAGTTGGTGGGAAGRAAGGRAARGSGGSSTGAGRAGSGGSGQATGGTDSSGGSTAGSNAAAGEAGAGAATGGSGGVFPLGISSDHRNLLQGDGTPFLIRGDSAWSAIVELSEADATTYLDSRASHGFNTILVNLLEAQFSSHDPKWRDAQGNVPFDDPDDWSALNDAYFAHVDWFLSEAEKRGILVLLAPAYLGYGCALEGWCTHMKNNGTTRLAQYGAYVGNRYKSFPNIVWVNGGDDTPQTTGKPSELDLVNAVANGIKQAEGGAHLHTAHWGEEVSGGEGPAVSWLDLDTTYTYTAPSVYQKLLSDRARDVGKRPFFLIESAYENEHQASNVELRSQMYQPVLSGGTGFVFGNFPIWSFWNPGDDPWDLADGKYPKGWKSALDGAGTKLASLAFDFFDALPWNSLTPDIDNAVLVDGYGDGDSYALCATDGHGHLAVTYTTDQLDMVFDMTKFSGPVTAEWFDPSTGATTSAGTALGNTGKHTFTPSRVNAGGDPDWVLILTAN